MIALLIVAHTVRPIGNYAPRNDRKRKETMKLTSVKIVCFFRSICIGHVLI